MSGKQCQFETNDVQADGGNDLHYPGDGPLVIMITDHSSNGTFVNGEVGTMLRLFGHVPCASITTPAQNDQGRSFVAPVSHQSHQSASPRYAAMPPLAAAG